ncbi:MAG: alanine racemase [Clostridiales bacterium]|nr:alanine racemase [Clostridiales bacterium]
MNNFIKRTWAEIDLDALVSNYQNVCQMVEKNTIITCVVKGNAYGHGSVCVAKTLEEVGCRSFGVSCVREGVQLRRGGIQGEILVMGLTLEEEVPIALDSGLTMTVSTVEQGKWIHTEARRRKVFPGVQVKLNTGMHRLGFPMGQRGVTEILQLKEECPDLLLEGIFSHLGLIDDDHDLQQHQAFAWMVEELKRRGLKIPQKHLCDSIGMLWYPKWHYDRVRIGALLYGVYPARTGNEAKRWKQTLTLKTVIAQIHEVKKGEYIGYDDTCAIHQDKKVAVLCAGYADGFPRVVYDGAVVIIRGQEAPILGIACMDQMMVDITHIPGVSLQDEATLLGGEIDYLRFATYVKTNRNEVLTKISQRPVRVYYRHGKAVYVSDGLQG